MVPNFWGPRSPNPGGWWSRLPGEVERGRGGSEAGAARPRRLSARIWSTTWSKVSGVATGRSVGRMNRTMPIRPVARPCRPGIRARRNHPRSSPRLRSGGEGVVGAAEEVHELVVGGEAPGLIASEALESEDEALEIGLQVRPLEEGGGDVVDPAPRGGAWRWRRRRSCGTAFPAGRPSRGTEVRTTDGDPLAGSSLRCKIPPSSFLVLRVKGTHIRRLAAAGDRIHGGRELPLPAVSVFVPCHSPTDGWDARGSCDDPPGTALWTF